MDYELRIVIEKVAVSSQEVIKRDTITSYALQRPTSIISTWTEIFPQNPSCFHDHHGDDMQEASNPWKATWHHPPISETRQR